MKRKRGMRDTAESRKPPLDDARGALSASRRAEAGGRQPRATAATRRRLPVIVAASIIALVVLAAAGAWFHFARGASPSFTRSPNQNVLLITIDTLRGDALGCYGGPASTPNLDRLAALGIRFDFAHSHAVVTLPSHASILTGRYPFEHGIHDNAGFRLPPSLPTLAALLKPRGMATGAFIGSFALDSRFGLSAGFDVYDERYGKSSTVSGFKMPERRADAVVSVAREWIGAQKGRWFAWVHVFDPHAPYRPPAPFDQQYPGRPYYGEVAYTDFALAPLLDAARDPSGRPTLVIVTGDHGEGLGDHGEQTHGLFAYEATLRIPLIVAQLSKDASAWGSGAATGTVGQAGFVGQASPPAGYASSVAARHVDIVPTVLDALGLPPLAGLPGRSLLPGSAGGQTTPPTSYFEAMSATFNRGWAPLTGVLMDRDKFVELPIPELYDLGRDAGETNNLAEKEAEKRRVLESRLRAYGASVSAPRKAEDAESRARLQALGYVAGSAPAKTSYTEADDPKRLVGVDQQLWRAIELYERRRPAEAIPIYRQIIAERPTMEIAYSQLAMLQWELGQPGEAIATLRAALAAGATSVETQAKLGIYLAESGRVKEAIPLLQHTTSQGEPDVDALNALGIALARSGQAGAAAATFRRILGLNPGNTMALENLGSIALGANRMDEARQLFTQALRGDSLSPQANNGLGVVELKSGNRKAAIDLFRRAVDSDPENYDALYNAATEMVNDGQLEAARPYLERFVRTAPPAFYGPDIQRVRAILAKLGG
jgi:arylsulfatase A-like enzyme/Tfp pilus assembly protein PilF